MSIDSDSDWRRLAQRLASQVRARAHVPLAEHWLRALSEVPRHEFVFPSFTPTEHDGWHAINETDCDWPALAYGLDTIAAHLDPQGRLASLCSNPVDVAQILHALDPHPGDTVLNLGVRIGYPAALLSHYLGGAQVFALNLDDTASGDRTRGILHRVGLPATVAAGDAEQGLPDHGPYDRIMSTVAVERIPVAWQEQLAPGGRIVTDLQIAPLAGQLVRLHHTSGQLGGQLEGHFLPYHREHAAARCSATPPLSASALIGSSDVIQTRTLLYPDPWTFGVEWFVAHLLYPEPDLRFGTIIDGATQAPDHTYLHAADGSWARIDCHLDPDGKRTVLTSGPGYLWERIERAHAEWKDWGAPGWDRFGLTVHGTDHTIWLDDPTGRRWTLPPAQPSPAAALDAMSATAAG